MSTIAFSKKIALRYLWSRRSEAFITIITIISILGVAIGVMVLNVVMGVMTGFESELREKIIGANAHITVRHISGRIADWRTVEEKVRNVPGVESVSAFTYNQALIRLDSGSAGVLIRGVEHGGPAAKQLASYLREPQLIEKLFAPPPVEVLTEEGKRDMVTLPGIIVGKELSKQFGIFEGQPVSLLSPTVTSSPFGLVPKFRRFVVASTYSSGLVEYESGLAYVSIEDAQRFFNLGDTVSGIEVRVKNIYSSQDLSKKIVESIGGFGRGFNAQDWTDSNKALWDAIRLEKKVYFLVLLLIIVMASFSIVSTLVMIVLEKRRDIAVLKTLGATRWSIGNIFRLQGAVIGGIGTVLGLILAYALCKGLQIYGFPIDERIFQMSKLPVRIEPINFLIVGVSAFLICCLATIYPAHRATKLDPSEVLRY